MAQTIHISNPRTPRRAQQPVSQRPPAFIPADPPFRQADWLVPRGAVFATALRTWTEDYKRHLFLTPDWVGRHDGPNPRAAPFPVALRTWALTDLLATTLGAQATSSADDLSLLLLVGIGV